MQLTTDEVVDLRCDVHEWMNAYLVPAETPYFAVTDASGSFAIDEIPAGTYTLRLWHEALEKTEQKVEVAAGKTIAVNFELAVDSAAESD